MELSSTRKPAYYCSRISQRRHVHRDHPSKPRWDPVTRFKLTRRGTLALNQSHPALKTYFNDVELSMKLHVIRNNAFPGEKSTLWYSLFCKANGTGDHSEGFYPRILQDKPFRMALFEAVSLSLCCHITIDI